MKIVRCRFSPVEDVLKFGFGFLEDVVFGVLYEPVVVLEGGHGGNILFGAFPLVFDLFAQVPGLKVVNDANVVYLVSMFDLVSARFILRNR